MNQKNKPTMQTQLKPQYQGAIIYLDCYRSNLKCIGITIPQNNFTWIGGYNNVSSKDMMKVIVQPIMETLSDIEVKDVNICFVTSVQDAIDNGWFEDEQSLIDVLNWENNDGDVTNGYSSVFELVKT